MATTFKTVVYAHHRKSDGTYNVKIRVTLAASLEMSDEPEILPRDFLHKGQYVHLAGSRTKDSDGMSELQILTCFKRTEDGVATYKKRREIETAFRAMNPSGFNIEDTHLRDRGRTARLLAMVRIALVWADLVGEHKDIYVKPIRILKHGRRAKSLVKHGLEEISNVLFRPTYAPKFDVFKFLSCTSRLFHLR